MNETEQSQFQPQILTLTQAEELAVIAERLKAHAEKTKQERAKALLDVAYDLVRKAKLHV
jgi:hypothetical protein